MHLLCKLVNLLRIKILYRYILLFSILIKSNLYYIKFESVVIMYFFPKIIFIEILQVFGYKYFIEIIFLMV